MRRPEIAVRPGDRAKLRRARDFGIVSCEPNGPSAPRRPLHRVRLGVLAARHAGAAHGGRPHRLGRDGCARQVAGPARQHQPPEEAEGEEGCPQARQGSSLPPLAALLPPPAATLPRSATRRARRILTRPPPHRRALRRARRRPSARRSAASSRATSSAAATRRARRRRSTARTARSSYAAATTTRRAARPTPDGRSPPASRPPSSLSPPPRPAVPGAVEEQVRHGRAPLDPAL